MPGAEAAELKQRWSRYWLGILVSIVAVSVLLLMTGSLFPTPENMFWFSSTLAQVAITFAAIIAAIFVYVTRRPDINEEFPTARPLLLFSSLFFIAAAMFALVDIASNPGSSPTLVDRARPLAGALFFIGGAALLHLSLIDLLEWFSP